MPTSNHSKEILMGNFKTQPCFVHGIFFLSQSLLTSQSLRVFTTSLESQESYLTLRNVTLQTRRSNTRDFSRQHNTFARLYNAAASPASRLRSAGSLAISTNRPLSEDCVRRSRMTSCHFEVWKCMLTLLPPYLETIPALAC